MDTSGFDLSALERRLDAAIPAALRAGMEPVKADAVAKVPKETEHLAETAAIVDAGHDRVALTFDGPYAAYQHERLDLHHPHGGQAKYEEDALATKNGEALHEVARSLRGAL